MASWEGDRGVCDANDKRKTLIRWPVVGESNNCGYELAAGSVAKPASIFTT